MKGVNKMKNKIISPLTITEDRYNGVYASYMPPKRQTEDCRYTAWKLTVAEVPDEINLDDVTCRNFWVQNKIPCGRGATIKEAIKDLLETLDEKFYDVNLL